MLESYNWRTEQLPGFKSLKCKRKVGMATEDRPGILVLPGANCTLATQTNNLVMIYNYGLTKCYKGNKGKVHVGSPCCLLELPIDQ